MNRFLLLCLALVVSAGSAPADVRCASIFGSHMVLQRDRPVAIWGTASPGESVTIDFAGQHQTAVAGADGAWQAHLAAMPASAESRSLIVAGRNTLTFTDVLVGEVWFCSGQSNMEKQIGLRKGHPAATDNYEAEIKNAHHPLLRLFQVPHHATPDPEMLGLEWVPCTPETIVSTQFSAVGYYFGRELLRTLGVPIGLIHSSFGASQIEAWLPEQAFARDARIGDLRRVQYPAWDQGMQATELFESMVKPYVPYTLRGFVWYQGEANAIQADDGIYTEKMRALVAAWRELWGDPSAPWYYVQIAPYLYSTVTAYGTLLTPQELPVFWEAQARALSIPHSGMVVTTDLAGNGRNIHPTDKLDVGLRLARLALAETYGFSGLLARSPSFATVHPAGQGRLAVEFRDVGSGLATRDGAAPSEFEVAGADRQFVPATAQLAGHAVIVSSERVKEPVAVRFGWRELANPNLVNSAELPAIPFRTDDWPIQRERAPKRPVR